MSHLSPETDMDILHQSIFQFTQKSRWLLHHEQHMYAVSLVHMQNHEKSLPGKSEVPV